MDWDATATALKAWFAALSGVTASDVVWAHEAQGMRGPLTADLRLSVHSSVYGDELLFSEPEDEDDDLVAEVRGNRVRTFSARIKTRDQRPSHHAYVVCERVRDRLDMPASQLALEELGVGILEVAAVTDLSRQWDNRLESEAVIDIRLNFASSEVELESGVGTIEHVRYLGTVLDGAAEILTDQTVTPLPEDIEELGLTIGGQQLTIGGVPVIYSGGV